MNARRKFEQEAKQILKQIIVTGEILALDDESKECLLYCQASNFVEGISVVRMASGRIVLDISNPRITVAGLEFLHPKTDVKFIISTTIAIIELIVIILQAILC